MAIPPQFQKAAKRKLAKRKMVEGSKAEEKTESPAFEKKEDAKPNLMDLLKGKG